MNAMDEYRLRMGFDAKDVEAGTQAMLKNQERAGANFVKIWTTNANKRIEIFQAAIRQEENAELASLKRREEAVARSEVNNDRVRQQIRYRRMKADEANIAAGSGGYGWRKDGLAKNQGGAAGMNSQMLAYQIGGDVAGGSDIEETASHSFGMAKTIAISTGIGIIFGTVGKALKKAAKKYGPKLLRGAGAASEGAGIAGMVTLPLAAGAELGKMFGADADAAISEMEKNASGVNLAAQTGSFGGRAQEIIDRLQKNSAITPKVAERLRGMTGEGGTSEGLRVAQRFMVQAQERESVMLAEKKAKAEHDATAAVQAAERAAQGKAHAEREAATALEKSKQLSNDLKGLYDRAADIRHAGAMIDNEKPSIADLAGRDYVAGLNAAYGAGGQFDLGRGDGPFAKDAQQALLWQKRQQWDVIHGNAVFNDKGELVGGQAFQDRKIRMGFENRLAAAGLETPEMQFKAMRDSLNGIQTDIAALYALADKDGIKIADTN